MRRISTNLCHICITAVLPPVSSSANYYLVRVQHRTVEEKQPAKRGRQVVLFGTTVRALDDAHWKQTCTRHTLTTAALWQCGYCSPKLIPRMNNCPWLSFPMAYLPCHALVLNETTTDTSYIHILCLVRRSCASLGVYLAPDVLY